MKTLNVIIILSLVLLLFSSSVFAANWPAMPTAEERAAALVLLEVTCDTGKTKAVAYRVSSKTILEVVKLSSGESVETLLVVDFSKSFANYKRIIREMWYKNKGSGEDILSDGGKEWIKRMKSSSMNYYNFLYQAGKTDCSVDR